MRIQIEILLGTLLVLATSLIIVIYGLNEEERMGEASAAAVAHQIEVGAELFDQQCSRCHGTQGLGIQGLCPPLNDRNFFDNRLTEVGWAGSLEDYIVATASSGRLTSTRPTLYPGQGAPSMPAFGDQFGGPLREDQIRAIAQYVMNWESTAELVEVAEAPEGPTVGTDITVELPEGNAENGEALSVSLGCTACHVDAPTGPPWFPTAEFPQGIGTRAVERLTQDDYTGEATTPEQYLLESIVLPQAHLVQNYANIMPQNYGDQLTPQDAADLIAYLLTIK